MLSSYEQYQEHLDHEYGAQYDNIRERYACQIQEARMEALIWREEQEYYSKVWDAGYGTDVDEYEAYWKRLEQYYNDIQQHLEQ